MNDAMRGDRSDDPAAESTPQAAPEEGAASEQTESATVDAPGADTAGAEVDGAGAPGAEALEAAQAEAAQFRDAALRAQAEMENVRRRAARDVEAAHKFALEKFASELLPVMDSLEKSVEAVSGHEGGGDAMDAIKEGIRLSERMFADTLGRFGLERIDPVGEPFDPDRHEAMTMIEAPHAEPNSVVDVLQKGYVLNGRLIRAAMVVVARGRQS